MKISDEILHKLHELDCEDVAKRFGIDVKRHKAHCFNHDDRIASLGFRGNHWKCFSCGIGGDAITFIQEKFSVSFVEACRILTDEYGIPISYGRYSAKRTSPIINWCKKESTSDTSCLFDREVAEFIMEHTTLTKAGFEFLREQRKIKIDVIESSKIRSIEETNHLKDIIQAQFGIDRLKTVKVLTSNGGYLTIDTPSLIIPYYDYNNNLIGLQTRYLGKVQSDFNIPRFKRICCSSIRLYNMQLLNSIQPGARIFITEGITDCLAMLSVGYDAVALPSATSFPTNDLVKLKNYNLYIVADQDRAGNDALIKLYRFMLRFGCEVKRIELPNGVKDFCNYYVKTVKN